MPAAGFAREPRDAAGHINFCQYDQISATFFSEKIFSRGEIHRPLAHRGRIPA